VKKTVRVGYQLRANARSMIKRNAMKKGRSDSARRRDVIL
jgi:hypothetical protein